MPELERTVGFLIEHYKSAAEGVSIKLEVEQRVAADLEPQVVRHPSYTPTYVRAVEGEDFYFVVRPDILVRARDVLIDSERKTVFTVKIPLEVVPIAEAYGLPMLEFKGTLSPFEIEGMKQQLGVAVAVSVKRRNVYLTPQAPPLRPIEASYDIVRSLGGRRFTEISQDWPFGTIFPRRFVTLLSDFKRKGVDHKLIFGVLDELGYSQQLIADDVAASHRMVTKTLEDLTLELPEVKPERRVYPEIQLNGIRPQ